MESADWAPGRHLPSPKRWRRRVNHEGPTSCPEPPWTLWRCCADLSAQLEHFPIALIWKLLFRAYLRFAVTLKALARPLSAGRASKGDSTDLGFTRDRHIRCLSRL
jgi:hypothetical protein